MEGRNTITILGATGSIGIQALEVLESLGGDYELGFITANSNIELLEEIANKYEPKGVVVGNENAYRDFILNTSFKGRILCGEDGIIEAACHPDNTMVLSSLVGFSGVRPTLAAIESGKNIALANKETLVSAGSVITEAVKKNNVKLLAVDSEHSAIAQCLAGESADSVEKLILTASGGPFFNTSLEKFGNITVQQALSHPNWSMGNKITIDSATMMNKGFEVIEAYWLFGIGADKIDVLIHPQSIVHSLVQFVDGSVKAQLGLPDMKLPIIYALSYNGRRETRFPRLDLADICELTFFKPDNDRFPCLGLAYESLRCGGTSPAVLNAANEETVNAFLMGDIAFNQIPLIIETVLNKIPIKQNPEIEDIIYYDRLSRVYTLEIIETKKN